MFVFKLYDQDFKNNIVKSWKLLRQRANRPEPSDDIIGSFGTILWKPRPKLRKKDFEGFH